MTYPVKAVVNNLLRRAFSHGVTVTVSLLKHGLTYADNLHYKHTRVPLLEDGWEAIIDAAYKHYPIEHIVDYLPAPQPAMLDEDNNPLLERIFDHTWLNMDMTRRKTR